MAYGVQSFYYSRQLPPRAVGIAEVSVPMLTPAQLTDVNNLSPLTGPVGIWKSSSNIAGAADFTAADLGVTVAISGSTSYYVGSQFLELTNMAGASGAPVFYKHRLSAGSTHPRILDLEGVDVTPSGLDVVSAAEGGVPTLTVYHNFDGSPYRIQYVNPAGVLVSEVLRYDHVISYGRYADTGRYSLNGSLLALATTGRYWIRFTERSGYQVMPMYTYLSNTPWYPRVRFGLNPPAVDWARQRFVKAAPWFSGSFVCGKVLDQHMIEFERKNMLDDNAHWPDILVFDKDNKFKYALDGFVGSTTSSRSTPYLKGTVYPWQRGQITSVDFVKSRVDVAVDLEPTDIVWGFYTYAERDVVYTDFDCNPFTNPAAKNTLVEFYTKSSGGDPNHTIYHQLRNAAGDLIAGQTNDPNPTTGTNTVFAQLVVGASVSEADFSLADARIRGGGLAPQYQSIPEAVNFWDIGYWDGKPYPIGAALAIYLPRSILNTLSRTDVEGRVNSVLPMGAVAVIRYLDENGMEWV